MKNFLKAVKDKLVAFFEIILFCLTVIHNILHFIVFAHLSDPQDFIRIIFLIYPPCDRHWHPLHWPCGRHWPLLQQPLRLKSDDDDDVNGRNSEAIIAPQNVSEAAVSEAAVLRLQYGDTEYMVDTFPHPNVFHFWCKCICISRKFLAAARCLQLI